MLIALAASVSATLTAFWVRRRYAGVEQHSAPLQENATPYWAGQSAPSSSILERMASCEAAVREGLERCRSAQQERSASGGPTIDQVPRKRLLHDLQPPAVGKTSASSSATHDAGPGDSALCTPNAWGEAHIAALVQSLGEELAERIDELKRAYLDPIVARFDFLNDLVSSTPPPPPAQDLVPLLQRLSQLERAIDRLSSHGPKEPDLAPVHGRLARIETVLAGRLPTGSGEQDPQDQAQPPAWRVGQTTGQTTGQTMGQLAINATGAALPDVLTDDMPRVPQQRGGTSAEPRTSYPRPPQRSRAEPALTNRPSRPEETCTPEETEVRRKAQPDS